MVSYVYEGIFQIWKVVSYVYEAALQICKMASYYYEGLFGFCQRKFLLQIPACIRGG